MNVHNSIEEIVILGSFFVHLYAQKFSHYPIFMSKSSQDVIKIGLLSEEKRGQMPYRFSFKNRVNKSELPDFILSIPFFRRMNHTLIHLNSLLITRFYLWALTLHLLWALSYLVISYKKRGVRFDSYCNQNFSLLPQLDID